MGLLALRWGGRNGVIREVPKGMSPRGSSRPWADHNLGPSLLAQHRFVDLKA